MTETSNITADSGVVLTIERDITEEAVLIRIRLDSPMLCVFHWGICRRGSSTWRVPPRHLWPHGSWAFGDSAIQTPFKGKDGVSEISLSLERSGITSVDFVLFFPDQSRWDNNRGRNYRIDIPSDGKPTSVAGLSQEIIEKETGRHSWTLMHRFNLCHDLLDETRDDSEGLALLYVWLRFSAIRQLDWQRNYNTKPRELGHSLDRLTLKLANRFQHTPSDRELTRLIMTTLGRGSNAQQVRDEILHIMHRHHIKETTGHFMEEWHQKLHNNTTPDDIVICEAYLAFLRSDGNTDIFYETLNEAGVTKERLEGFERPIRSAPDFIWHLKDALIYDFEHFLGILKAVHTGTDLGTAIYHARRHLDAGINEILDHIWAGREKTGDPLDLAAKVTEARRRLSEDFKGSSERMRDLIFLDLGLEDFFRLLIERDIHTGLSGDTVIDLIGLAVEHVVLSHQDEELGRCLRHWRKLSALPRFDRLWSLHARAVSERMSRGLGGFIDRISELLQPKAGLLGKAFGAATWTIGFFSEEVLRGRPAFALSMLLLDLDPLLRQRVELGDWQVVGPGSAKGFVHVSPDLRQLQGHDFGRPTVIVVGKVTGNEEIPKGVTALLTTTAVDLLSHIAVRARNASVLLGTCYEKTVFNRLKSLSGRFIAVRSDRKGGISFEETEETVSPSEQQVRPAFEIPAITLPSEYVLPMAEFNERAVGRKSMDLRRLIGRLPSRIFLPSSVALPFGTFEKVIGQGSNRETKKIYDGLKEELEKADLENSSVVIDDIQAAIRRLVIPDDILSALVHEMDKASIPQPSDWEEASVCLKDVWASKWNERAYLSRKANGFPHDSLFMAVLIQEVVGAEYSFVVHTVNPFTGDPDELYAEVVSGLGEALVGNYPGRAMGFTFRKKDGAPRVLSFPGKGVGLFGKGIIFRSDSNGEDLAGYSGAGLYDSLMCPAGRRLPLDYMHEPLVWDEGFRTEFLSSIAEIGIAVEDVLGPAQDIEGAYTEGKFYVVQSRPQVGL